VEDNLKIGIKGVTETIVSVSDTAVKYGSGLVEVFATPAMIALMEKTCLESVLTFLEDDEGTVGTAVNIVHLKASPIGAKIVCETELVEIDGKRLTFYVSARDDNGEIGRGTHERFIINTDKFMAKL
jgi:predicted thioesterase